MAGSLPHGEDLELVLAQQRVDGGGRSRVRRILGMLAVIVVVLSASGCGESATAVPDADDASPSLTGVDIDVHQSPG